MYWKYLFYLFIYWSDLLNNNMTIKFHQIWPIGLRANDWNMDDGQMPDHWPMIIAYLISVRWAKKFCNIYRKIFTSISTIFSVSMLNAFFEILKHRKRKYVTNFSTLTTPSESFKWICPPLNFEAVSIRGISRWEFAEGQRTVKSLVRLHICVGWAGSILVV